MIGDTRIARALPRILEELGAGPTPDYTDDILARAASMRQRPDWTFPEHWLPTTFLPGQVVIARRLPLRAILAVGLIAIGLAAGALVVGSRHRPLPPPTGPAGNGLIAYDSGGDIYVGDPVTGMTSAIVAGPEQDRSPIFSPDGTRIAFVRRSEVGTQPAGAGHPFGNSDLTGTSDIVVVRPDGSDLRVITPERLVGLELAGWTPDSAWIEAMLFAYTGRDWTYQGWMFDASGPAEPRVSEPRVDLAQAVARPDRLSPSGDRTLLLGDTTFDGEWDLWHSITLTDADGGHPVTLVDRSRLASRVVPTRQVSVVKPGPYVLDASWSPDGSTVAFQVGVAYELPCGQPYVSPGEGRTITPACRESWTFVMNDDGSDIRPAATSIGAAAGDAFVMDGYPSWSPDGSKIVFDRQLIFESGEERCCTVVVADVATGTEREIDTDVTGYDPGYLDRRSWSPDGRSLLFYDFPGIRLVIVDVETGRATELPWQVGLAPSWQRVPLD